MLLLDLLNFSLLSLQSTEDKNSFTLVAGTPSPKGYREFTVTVIACRVVTRRFAG
ncbi:23S rRNA 5-methyluridine methyltransferase [Yersinia mollaretii ATCC 43969]|uniref:23S rRNA 5-methyluridine methyltransferase n=1 Tax=Yersinia mollaretii (strain ATCC 43969 / DSM 18520 / CIP 103324 / CNY 7263 / WAIP 204) TaxID=349967 RepID=A0ABP2EG67_YERMW|nr:23S rRNA 5-methyluridine methyltransferase [Yersinia mollaretii ATCC 43969]